MITYEFECKSCGVFEEKLSMGDTLDKCPNCDGEDIRKLISGGCHAFVDPGITTLGKQIDVNNKKMGKYKRSEEFELTGGKEKEKTRENREKHKKISKMSDSQKEKYINTGEM